ncbi:MAG: phosphoglucosamine mutase, partial [Planctomycetales bacterium]
FHYLGANGGNLMAEPIISVSGLRGIIGESLSPDTALRYACAFASEMDDGPIVLSHDGRPSGPMLTRAIESGLQAVGRTVINAGICATPTTGIVVRTEQAAGGVQVTASHNPSEYNGIKLFSSEGMILSESSGERVRNQYHSGSPNWVAHDQIGSEKILADPHLEHAKSVLPLVDAQRLQVAKFKVVLDSNHGSGGRLGRFLLELFGCQVVVLGESSNGRFAHLPEPTEANLQDVLSQVVKYGAAVGFCQDPNADRLAVIDEQGRYLGEEATLGMCAAHLLQQSRGPLVTNCATSRVLEDLASQYGVPFHRTKVGEAHVRDKMRETEALIGGEGNGGVIDPRVGFVRDSFAGMAILLEAMAARECPISQLADELPQYAMFKGKAALPPEETEAAFGRIRDRFPDATASSLDGLRMDWPDKWVLIRPSNTEPITRVIAEAKTAAQARALHDQALQAVQGG